MNNQKKRKKSNSLGVLLMISSFMIPVAFNPLLPTPVVAQRNQINLISRGDGLFSLEGRQQTPIKSASLNIRNARDGEVSLILNNNNVTPFSGRVVRRNSNMFTLEIKNSGMANANGSLLVEHNDNEIIRIEGKGLLDSQRFSVTFTSGNSSSGNNNTNTTSMNLQQRGQGIFNIQGRNNQTINSVSVRVNNQGNATVSLSLSGGNSISFDGQQSHRDSTNIKINVTNSGNASASGFINIRYGANNSIIDMVGDGNIDGQSFLISFSN